MPTSKELLPAAPSKHNKLLPPHIQVSQSRPRLQLLKFVSTLTNNISILSSLNCAPSLRSLPFFKYPVDFLSSKCLISPSTIFRSNSFVGMNYMMKLKLVVACSDHLLCFPFPFFFVPPFSLTLWCFVDIVLQ